jgi:hypothetical protein
MNYIPLPKDIAKIIYLHNIGQNYQGITISMNFGLALLAYLLVKFNIIKKLDEKKSKKFHGHFDSM